MKRILVCLLLFYSLTASSQTDKSGFMRLYVDNDAFVPINNAADWGYTSGIRIDLFHSSPALRGYFQGLNNYNHGDRVNTAGWGLMQLMFAPKKTSLTIPDKQDYPYSAALVAIRSFHSSYEKRKINVRSEIMAGLMGPPALGKPVHRFFHRLINDPLPAGWDHQLPADLLINANLYIEKSLFNNKNSCLLGSGEIRAGTMEDALIAGAQLRLGNTTGYFRGLQRQLFNDKKIGFVFSIAGSAELVAYNALLQGGLFNRHSPVHDHAALSGTNRTLERIRGTAETMLQLNYGKFTLAITEKMTTAELKGFEPHPYGNISLIFRYH